MPATPAATARLDAAGFRSSTSAPVARKSIDTPTSTDSAPHSRVSSPSSVT